MSEIQFIRAWMLTMRRRVEARDEAGAEVPSWVILTAVVASGTIAIGAIVIAKFKAAAGNIPTGP